MHMKHVLLACDDLHALAWVRDALGGIDAELVTVPLDAARSRLADGGLDGALLDAARSPETIIGMLERVAAEGVELRVLLLVDSEALPSFRLPVTFRCDFAVRTASPMELAARLRALVWPGEEAAPQDVIRIDALSINIATYQVAIAGQPVEFTFQEYELFKFLVTHPNRVYGREVLLRRVWGTAYFGGARTVDVHVRRVRSKLGPEIARRLETVRNVGYLWRS
jgi:DNA-binding response OmpR family regulator